MPNRSGASSFGDVAADASFRDAVDGRIPEAITDFDYPSSVLEASSPTPLYDMGEDATLGTRSCERNDF